MSLLRLEPRHTKGFLTLTLFVLAESVTFSNAVSFWSKFQQQQSQHKNTGDSSFFEQQQQQAKPSSSFFAPRSQILPQEDSSCDATKPLAATASSTSRKALGRSGGILKQWMMGDGNSNTRSDPSYCCAKCTGCMEDSTVAGKVASLCRGGHGIHSHDSNHPIDAMVSSVTPFNLPLNAWKVIFQFFLTALNVACWLIPLKSKKISENKLGLSLANAFSGGVFLSLAFGHLIPECVHGFEAYNEATPFLLVLAGYLLIFFIEKVAFDAHDILHEMADHDHSHTAGPAAPRGGHVGHSSSSTANGAAAPTGAASSGRSAVILLGALAVHSILEMMALGLSNSFSDCALLTLSISLHQPAESIALLVAFLKSGLSHDQIIRFLSIFSCMGPIGVLLGMLVNEYAAPIVDSIMLAIVAGTFVYVGATEVIPEEWEDSTHKWKKFLALLSGIVSILAITQYTMTLGH